ncbi:signal transduction histidine kinase [Saccharothrix tamanrassetensis]|uniref:histidine kinase n=1 Tax=Saccharothrix tamanrassetensis TaxID=1051531 RepID=A0A841CG15_9PSEU|nr:histidine kinase [Saccharothrix tamanrassetensis]MBB5957462.1 signal transduction histidine kinase [Saccharothrix tamanrassetensis]
MKRIPRWAVALLVAVLTVVALSAGDLGGWAYAGALVAPVAALAVLDRSAPAALGVCTVAAQALALALGDSVPPWAVALGAALGVISFLAGRRSPRAVPALAVVAVLSVPPVLVDVDAWATGLLATALAVALPWLVGRSARQQADLAAAAAERVHLRERARIAHDMHDTLGHELSLLALRAGALELSPDLPGNHRTAVGDLRAAAGAATERLADLVTILRDGEPAPLHPGSEDIADLVGRATRAGVTATVDWSGPTALPALTERTAHRVVQEALTNATKHAPGVPVRIRVVNTSSATTIAVSNDVPAGARRGAGARTGLTALRERVRLVGGTFEVNRGDGTFEVVATLPRTAAPPPTGES